MSGCHIEHIILLRATHRPAKTGHFFCVDVPKLGFKGQNSYRHRKISRFFCDDDAKSLPYPEYRQHSSGALKCKGREFHPTLHLEKHKKKKKQ